ncbi:1-acylglycerol-3-phosphate O-acyltransferase [Vibrio ulleungensis]|jgi:1-acyl-sn-glycerol-3-phosphate acyltransferase|uniref:1-acyl-sn-glycerol-3-phosphate acyltransferase n=1 Tax=Vibrio ulleungensis TaxID=2807619 RepID=A0ABS2HPM1_9VIBR|nr:1-acylglycerol-3-phosphate O-acyltransferase [Vibrio ulleungensis]MBM7037994.1 1-acylglycerol-3-phosphate O-acyltransferase [Vibrio ulleungensis]
MIALLRVIAVAIFAVLMFVFGCGYCLLSPRDSKHVFNFGRMFGAMHRVFGITLELRLPKDAYERGQHVYIANHQNSWDMFTISSAVTPHVVTVGKKSLVWLPLFGQLYWLTGNILIDRANSSRAKGTIDQVVQKIKESGLSVWMFPEGTRSRGRGMLPFKTGAFHAAIGSGVNIVPIVCSTTHQKIKMNRWNNGHVIVEMLDPVNVADYDKSDVRGLANVCREKMEQKLAELDIEVEQRNQADGVIN